MTRSVSLHVSLGMVIDNDRMLFIHRYDPQIPEYHQRWELPGGKIEPDESSADAACREVLEETGYRVQAIQRVPYTYYSEFPQEEPALHVHVDCWLCEPASIQDELPIDAEQEGTWHRLSNIPFDVVIPGSREFALWGVHSKLGPQAKLSSIYRADLESVDESRRRKRRYTLLLGYEPEHETAPFTVDRLWGGVHAPQRFEQERYDSMDQAVAALMDRLKKRRTHGYKVTHVESAHPLRSWLLASGMPHEASLFPPLISDPDTTDLLQRSTHESPTSIPSISSSENAR